MATTTHIPLLYRIYFHWLDPANSLMTAYFCLFQRTLFLKQLTVMIRSRNVNYDPVLWQVAGLYLLIATLQAWMLRYTNEIAVWKITTFGVMIVDVMILGSMLELNWGPNGLALGAVRRLDWSNGSLTLIAIFIRIAFIAGVGLETETEKKDKKKQ